MKKIHVFLTTILAFLLLTAGGSIMVKAEEAAASSAVQAGKGLVVEGSPEGYTYEKGTLCFIKGGSYTVSMAPDTPVTTDVIMVKGDGNFALTLNSVQIATDSEGQQGMPLYVQQGDLSLTLAGSSNLKSEKTSALFIGDEGGGTNASKLTVAGSGTLTLRSGSSFAFENLGLGGTFMEGGQIHASNAIVDGQGIKAIAIQAGAKEVYAISAHFAEKLTMNGGSLTAEVDNGETPIYAGAVYCYNGLEVNGGTLSGKAPGAGISTGDGEGKGGACVINGGTVIGDAVERGVSYGTSGISVIGNITINGGSVTAKNGYVGLDATNILAINGGQVNASGSQVGIHGGACAKDKEKDNVTITGGTVYARGDKYDIYGGDFGSVEIPTRVYLKGGSIFTGSNKIKPEPISYVDEDSGAEIKVERVVMSGLPADSSVFLFFKVGYFGEDKADPENGVYGIRDMDTNDKGQLCVYASLLERSPFGVTINGTDYEGVAVKGSNGYEAKMEESIPEMAVTSENGHTPFYFKTHYILEPGNSTASMREGQNETDEKIMVGKTYIAPPDDITADYYRLTLDNIKIHSENIGIQVNNHNTELIARGDNSIVSDDDHAIFAGFISDSGDIDTLAFSGSGRLSCEVAPDKRYGAIISMRNIVVNSGTITAHSASSTAIFSESQNPEDSITVNGGDVNVKGSFGLYGNNITINGGKVTGTDEGDTETLVVGSKGDISFNGGSVDVKSGSYAVGANGNITISGGTHHLLAENDNNQYVYGLYANGSIYVNGGTTWVSGNTNDILAETAIQERALPSTGKTLERAAAGEHIITVDGGSLNAVHNTVAPEPVDAAGARAYKTTLTVGTAANTGSLEGKVGEKTLNLKDALTDDAANLYLYLPEPEGQKAVIATTAASYSGTVRELEAQNRLRTFGAVLVSDKPEPVVHVTGVRLDKTSAELTQGKSLTLTAAIEPANATNKKMSWKSSDSKIAKVDNQGKVTGIAVGKATITVTTEDGGKTASAVITVKKAGGDGPHTGILSEQTSVPAALILLAGFTALTAVAARRR